MLEICTSAKLFTFLVSNLLFEFVYFEYIIKIKNDFGATVLIVLDFNGVTGYVSVFHIYMEERNELSTFAQMDKPRKKGTKRHRREGGHGESVLQGHRANVNDYNDQ